MEIILGISLGVCIAIIFLLLYILGKAEQYLEIVLKEELSYFLSKKREETNEKIKRLLKKQRENCCEHIKERGAPIGYPKYCLEAPEPKIEES